MVKTITVSLRCLIYLFSFIFLTGCGVPLIPTSGEFPTTGIIKTYTTPPSGTPVIIKPISTETPQKQICEWLPQQPSPIIRYNLTWSSDSNGLYYSDTFEPLNWNFYTLETQEDKKNISPPDFLLHLDPEQIAANCSIEDFEDIYLSPAKDKIIYTQRDSSHLHIYLKDDCDHKAKYIGSIDGVIDQWIWFPSRRKILISIDWQSSIGVKEAHVYLMDLIHESVSIIIPATPAFADTTLYGYTPDEKYAMYVVYSHQERNLRFFNIQTSESIMSSVPYPPKSYKWISPTTFIAVGKLSSDISGDSIYLFDYLKDQVQVIFPESLKLFHGDVSISPDGDYIAYIDANSLMTRIVSCGNK